METKDTTVTLPARKLSPLGLRKSRKIAASLRVWMKWLDRKFGGRGNTTHYRKAVTDFMRINRVTMFRNLRSHQIDRYIEAKLNEHDYTSESMKKRVKWIMQFFGWACRRNRIPNPLADFSWENCPFHGHRERVRPRRALTSAEWEWLWKVTLEKNIRRRKLTAEDRVLLYRTVIQTGFRAVECSRLRVMDLHFLPDRPHVAALHLPGKAVRGLTSRRTKNGKPAVQYIQIELANDLRAMVRRRESGWSELLRKPDNPLFRASRNAWRRIAESVTADLRDARAEYVADQARKGLPSDPNFLAVKNLDGENIDFHALRHTTATWMAEERVDPGSVREVMRHQTAAMTEHYTHLSAQLKIDAVMRLKGV